MDEKVRDTKPIEDKDVVSTAITGPTASPRHRLMKDGWDIKLTADKDDVSKAIDSVLHWSKPGRTKRRARSAQDERLSGVLEEASISLDSQLEGLLVKLKYVADVVEGIWNCAAEVRSSRLKVEGISTTNTENHPMMKTNYRMKKNEYTFPIKTEEELNQIFDDLELNIHGDDFLQDEKNQELLQLGETEKQALKAFYVDHVPLEETSVDQIVEHLGVIHLAASTSKKDHESHAAIYKEAADAVETLLKTRKEASKGIKALERLQGEEGLTKTTKEIESAFRMFEERFTDPHKAYTTSKGLTEKKIKNMMDQLDETLSFVKEKNKKAQLRAKQELAPQETDTVVPAEAGMGEHLAMDNPSLLDKVDVISRVPADGRNSGQGVKTGGGDKPKETPPQKGGDNTTLKKASESLRPLLEEGKSIDFHNIVLSEAVVTLMKLIKKKKAELENDKGPDPSTLEDTLKDISVICMKLVILDTKAKAHSGSVLKKQLKIWFPYNPLLHDLQKWAYSVLETVLRLEAEWGLDVLAGVFNPENYEDHLRNALVKAAEKPIRQRRRRKSERQKNMKKKEKVEKEKAEKEKDEKEKAEKKKDEKEKDEKEKDEKVQTHTLLDEEGMRLMEGGASKARLSRRKSNRRRSKARRTNRRRSKARRTNRRRSKARRTNR